MTSCKVYRVWKYNDCTTSVPSTTSLLAFKGQLAEPITHQIWDSYHKKMEFRSMRRSGNKLKSHQEGFFECQTGLFARYSTVARCRALHRKRNICVPYSPNGSAIYSLFSTNHRASLWKLGRGMVPIGSIRVEHRPSSLSRFLASKRMNEEEIGGMEKDGHKKERRNKGF